MKPLSFVSTVAVALLVIAATTAVAEPSKLDPTARIALAGLRSGVSAQALQAEGRLAVSSAGELDVFVVGDVSRAQLEAAGARVRTALPGVYTAWIPVDRVDAVAAIAGVERIEGAQIAEATNDQGSLATGAATFRGPGPTFSGINGAGVIVGNIDTGVDYDHDDFKDAGGNTRILRIWDQIDLVGPNPAGFGYGSEWNSASIDALTSRAKDTNGHGSHTMGSAAGDGSATAVGSAPAYTYAGMAPMADIIVVDGSASGSFSSTEMVDGINYIFTQATAFGKNAVVNCSIGGQSGPKDGTGAFELAADALCGPGRMVVMSAGNDRGASLHNEWFTGNPSPTMVISSGVAAARRVRINGYYEASEELNVSIQTPSGTVIGPIALGGLSGLFPGPLTANGNVYIENGVSLTSTLDKQIYIELNAATGAIISGLWRFTFTPVVIGPANCEVDMFRFFMSTSMTADFGAGNQPSEEIINALATGVNTVAAGAWVSRQNWTDCNAVNWNDPANVTFGQPGVGSIASFSSPGPTRDGRIKPDVGAPGTAILSARTTDLATACPSPSLSTLVKGLRHVANQGTSMSAPHVTGAVALLYQKYGALTPAQVQALLHSRAVVDATVLSYGAAPNKDFGWGKLNVGDLSDPLCAVTGPNGGELIYIHDAQPLTWSASDANFGVTGVDVELSRNGGGSWTTLATNAPNTGSYVWTVTAPPTVDALLRVTARDAAGNTGQDLSNAVWTIDYLTPVGVEDERAITEFTLDAVASGAAAGAVVEYAVPRAAEVSVAMFDLQGREVATLASGSHAVGRYRVAWDGLVEGGQAAAGVYFVRLMSPGVSRTDRFVMTH